MASHFSRAICRLLDFIIVIAARGGYKVAQARKGAAFLSIQIKTLKTERRLGRDPWSFGERRNAK